MKISPLAQKRQGTGTGRRGKGRGARARGSSSKTVQEPESESGDEYVSNMVDRDGPSAIETSQPRLRPRARPVAKGSRISDRYTVLAEESEGS
jgi:DNA excision repair protein ERCC-5